MSQPTTGENSPRLLDQVRSVIRLLHYSVKTEKSYIYWIRFYIRFHKLRHPKEMGPVEITQFLSFLAQQRNVSPSTQNQALNAISFLYRKVLQIELGEYSNFVRARPKRRLPVVLTHEEATRILQLLQGREWLMANLLYGCGLRITECMRLRVKDLDFHQNALIVREGKGGKDRVTVLPQKLVPHLKQQLDHVKNLHQFDLSEGYGDVYLPYAIARKYPNAGKSFAWQYVFPASQRSVDPRSGVIRRHHLDETVLQKAVRRAVREAGINKPASCHTFRHSFATRLIQRGNDIRTVQELLGHAHVHTTEIYTHVLKINRNAIISPIDD